jgi:hypothetical protein
MAEQESCKKVETMPKTVDERLWKGNIILPPKRCRWCGAALAENEGYNFKSGDESTNYRVCDREHAETLEDHLRRKYPGYKPQ